MNDEIGPLLLTAKQVGDLLAISPARVMELAHAGELQVMSISHPDVRKRRGRGEYRFGRADVEAYVRSKLGYIRPAEAAAGARPAARAPAPKAGERFRIR